jgi:hypothetical protein
VPPPVAAAQPAPSPPQAPAPPGSEDSSGDESDGDLYPAMVQTRSPTPVGDVKGTPRKVRG